jgi:hypothetical protein
MGDGARRRFHVNGRDPFVLGQTVEPGYCDKCPARGGNMKTAGISITRSGSPNCQPEAISGGASLWEESPSGMPPAAGLNQGDLLFSEAAFIAIA